MGDNKKSGLQWYLVLIFVMTLLCLSYLSSSALKSSKVIREARLFSDPMHEFGDLRSGQKVNASLNTRVHDMNSIILPRIQRDLKVQDPLGETSPKTSVLISCYSFPNNFAQRDVIRETWASDLDIYPFTLIFLLGKSTSTRVQKDIEFEATLHQDILQEDFKDSHRNLSIKSLFMLKYLNYLTNIGVPIHYVLKMNDDSYLSLKALFKFIPIAKRHPSVVFGKGIGIESLRVPGPNSGSKNLNHDGKQPNVSSKSEFLFALKVGLCYYSKALDDHLMDSEDIFHSGIINIPCGIHFRNHSRFHSTNQSFCDIRKSRTLIHPVKYIQQMFSVHEIMNCVRQCQEK